VTTIPLHDPAHHPLVVEGHAHIHEATMLSIGWTSIIGLIVTEVALGAVAVVLLPALPPGHHFHNVLKAQFHLARPLTDPNEGNP
jgi:hypothetical protein